jgi:hypothetical protein
MTIAIYTVPKEAVIQFCMQTKFSIKFSTRALNRLVVGPYMDTKGISLLLYPTYWRCVTAGAHQAPLSRVRDFDALLLLPIKCGPAPDPWPDPWPDRV